MEQWISSFIQSGAIFNLNSDTLLIGYGSCKQIEKASDLDLTKPAFYFPDFFLQDSKPWRQYVYWQELKVNVIQQVFNASVKNASVINWLNPYRSLFENMFIILQRDWLNVKLDKAVPYAFAYALEKMTENRLKNCLIKAFQHIQQFPCYLYGFWGENEGILGVTPEVLFKFNNDKKVQMIALAGTCSNQDCSNNFKHNPKELHEHNIVIEGIKKDLEKWGTLRQDKLQILSLPTLSHLMTSLELEAHNSIDFEQLVKALHPTPALGTFPKQSGMEWLKSYQKVLNRGRYGAPAGYIYPQKRQSQCLVAIRNVQWDKSAMRIGAGCGVVKESECEKEWNEINLKMQAICDLLSL